MHPKEAKCATVSDDGMLRTWQFGAPTIGGDVVMHLEGGPARAVAYSSDASLIAVGYKNGKSV